MADVIYYNLAITNDNFLDTGSVYGPTVGSTRASISAYNNIPIIDNPNDYYCSIIRFSVPGFGIPLVQFLVQTPVSDVNLGIYSFTLNYNSFTSGQVFYQYVPEVTANLRPVPATGTPNQNFASKYYFIYDYVHIYDIVNTALATAFTLLQTAASPALDTCKVPFFNYNPQTQLVTLYADKLFFDQVISTTDIQADTVYIFMNSVSEIFFNGIKYYTQNIGALDGTDLYFCIKGYNGTNIGGPTVLNTDYLLISQQFVSLCYLSLLQNIIIGTQMSVVSETTFINQSSSSQNQVSVNTLTDYIPDLSGGNEAGISSKIFIYNATSLYRIFQFKQKDPLYNVTANVYFVDAYQNYYSVQIPKSMQVNIKFMFFKKTLWDKLSQTSIQNIDLTGLSIKNMNSRIKNF